uniref:TolC family protein n=1 Tax=Flavobacterium sp. TaxID=239 RepID=UPI00404ABB6C
MSHKHIFTVLVLLLFNISQAQKKWTLEECIRYAIDNNINVRQSALDVETTNIDKKDAFGAFLPTANANASHSWNIGLNQNITTGLLENQTTQFTSAGFNVGVDIYNGLQNQNRLRRAELAKISSQYQLVKMQEDIALNVANAYLQILFNIENLKVQQEQLASDKIQMTRSQELVDAGVIPRGDLLEVKATVAGDEQRVVLAKNTLLISKLSLAQLLQLDDFSNFDVIEENYNAEETNLLSQTPATIYAKAKETRTELKIAQSNLEIAERDLKIAKGAYQPRIQGFYSLNTRASYADRIVGSQIDPLNPTVAIGTVEGTGENVVRPNFTTIVGGPASVWDQFETNKGQNYGLQINIPIFNGFSARNNVQRSKIAVERSKIAVEQQELDLERNVFTAFTDVKGSLNAYEAALSALESREEAFRYAKERFDVGMMNAFEFNQAQTLFVNAQSEVIRAKYDYIFKVKILEFYFGIPIIK